MFARIPLYVCMYSTAAGVRATFLAANSATKTYAAAGKRNNNQFEDGQVQPCIYCNGRLSEPFDKHGQDQEITHDPTIGWACSTTMALPHN